MQLMDWGRSPKFQKGRGLFYLGLGRARLRELGPAPSSDFGDRRRVLAFLANFLTAVAARPTFRRSRVCPIVTAAEDDLTLDAGAGGLAGEISSVKSRMAISDSPTGVERAPEGACGDAGGGAENCNPAAAVWEMAFNWSRKRETRPWLRTAAWRLSSCACTSYWSFSLTTDSWLSNSWTREASPLVFDRSSTSARLLTS